MASNKTRTLIAKAKRANPQLVAGSLARRARMRAAKAGILISRVDEETRRYVNLTNNDTVTQQMGPLSVQAGSVLKMRFARTGTIEGTCTMNPEGTAKIVIQE